MHWHIIRCLFRWKHCSLGLATDTSRLVVTRRQLLLRLAEEELLRGAGFFEGGVNKQPLSSHKWIDSVITDGYGVGARIFTTQVEVVGRHYPLLGRVHHTEPLILRFGIPWRQLSWVVNHRAIANYRRLHLF